MFSLLHNIDRSIAPAHSTFCSPVAGGGCVSLSTTPQQEAAMIDQPNSFMSHLWDSDKVRCARFRPQSCLRLRGTRLAGPAAGPASSDLALRGPPTGTT
jgi:hypothetical protein